MVRWSLFLLILAQSSLYSEVSVAANVIQDQEGPVYGILQVEGLDYEQVSATLNGTPVVLERGVDGTFRFKPPEISEGLHLLPSLSVLIDGKTYQTASVSYKIVRVLPERPLHLEGEIKGERPFYPGQRIQLIYRIYYRGAVDLTVQEFPFFDAGPFLKVGSLQVNESTWNEFNVQEIIQEVELEEPGEFLFKEGVLEGTSNGETVRSKTVETVVEVLPFPEEGKPPSFNGVLGEYIMNVSLLSGSNVRVGEPFKLEVKLLGKGAFHTLKPQRLACAPGFSGFFTVDEIAKIEKIEGGKQFVFTLHPNVALYPFVPSIEFSSFSRTLGYQIVRSDPIPLSFRERKQAVGGSKVSAVHDESKIDWKKVLGEHSPPKQATSLALEDSRLPAWIGGWSFTFFVFLFCSLLFIGEKWRQLKIKNRKGKKTRAYLAQFDRAKKEAGNREECLKWLEKTLVSMKGQDKLLQKVRACRFSRETSFSTQELIKEVEHAILREKNE